MYAYIYVGIYVNVNVYVNGYVSMNVNIYICTNVCKFMYLLTKRPEIINPNMFYKINKYT